jgi:hypothetical protein
MATRSGRVVKKPAIFIPTETVLDDDYCTDDYNTDIGSDEECLSDESESEYDDDDADADENGNLQDFVVDDEEESESEDA